MIYVYLSDWKDLIHVLVNDLSVQKSAFPRAQTLHYKNGFAVPCPPTVEQDPLLSEQLIQEDVNKLTFETPDLRFESLSKIPPKELVPAYVPAYVALDKKVRYNFEDKE